MPIFKYRPYYHYNGPTIREPLLDQLSEDEVERNLLLLVEDLKNHFKEIGGDVEELEDGVILINVDLSKKECDDIVGGYLSNLHLFANKMSEQ